MKSIIEIVTLPVGQMAANCYVVYNTETREALVVDPGDDGQHIINTLQKYNLTPLHIFATHGHFDHIMAAAELSLTYNIPFSIHKDDEFLIQRMSETAKHFLHIPVPDPPPLISSYITPDHDLVELGTTIQVIHTPGHTPGSVCFYIPAAGCVIVGDVVFTGGHVGRTDFSYSNPEVLTQSIKHILTLETHTTVYSGHGEPTTVEALQQYF